jgi:AcrR family transcriptional regulator
MTDVTERARAAALPPGERRAAIVAAALPLIQERGTSVTTKQLAEAAGIAEGTIFRVFPDKDALVQAVVEAALDTSDVEATIGAIDRQQPFETQLEEAVRVMQGHLDAVWRLLGAIARTGGPRKPGATRPSDFAALTALFEDQRRHLRLDPARAARALRGITIASSHPGVFDEPLSPEEIVSVLLDGVRIPSRPRRERTS